MWTGAESPAWRWLAATIVAAVIAVAAATALLLILPLSSATAAGKAPRDRMIYDGSVSYTVTRRYSSTGDSTLNATVTQTVYFEWHLEWDPDPQDPNHLTFLLNSRTSRIAGSATSTSSDPNGGPSCSAPITVQNLADIQQMVVMRYTGGRERLAINMPLDQVGTCFGGALSDYVAFPATAFHSTPTFDVNELARGADIRFTSRTPLSENLTPPGGPDDTASGTATGAFTYGPAFDYVALGDSFAAGDGVAPPFAADGAACHRASGAYPLLYDPDAGFFACSGAQISDILADSIHGEPPQIDHVSSFTRLVTVSIGGNDAELFGALEKCVTFGFIGTRCKNRFGIGPAIAASIRSLPARLASLLALLRARAAPNARIALVGYPNPLPATEPGECKRLEIPNTRGIVKLPDVDIEWFHEQIDDVNAALKHAAEAHHGIYVAPFTGHDVCGEHPWFNRLSRSFHALHPNGAGTAAMATEVRAALGPGPS